MRRLVACKALAWTAAAVITASGAAAITRIHGAPEMLDALAVSDSAILDLSAAIGMKLDALTVEGRAMTAREDLLAALDIERGIPILSVNVAQARAAIETLPWVKSAKIERRLPGSLHILLEERAPYALWQRGDRYTLVDQSGNTIVDVPDADPALPLIVGPDAPQHAAALFEALQTEIDLAGRVRGAVRVGARRWNVYLDAFDGGIAILLPEVDVTAAWARLATLEREHKILERDLDFIDMRLEDRLVVRIHSDSLPGDPALEGAAPTNRKKAPLSAPVMAPIPAPVDGPAAEPAASIDQKRNI